MFFFLWVNVERYLHSLFKTNQYIVSSRENMSAQYYDAKKMQWGHPCEFNQTNGGKISIGQQILTTISMHGDKVAQVCFEFSIAV